MKVNKEYLERAKKELEYKFSKKQLVEKYYEIAEKAEGKWANADFYALSVAPTNEEQAIQYGNALANSGNYPVGLSGCFCVGISGGCGCNCYVLNKGECEEFVEVVREHNMQKYQIKKLYDKGFYKKEIENFLFEGKEEL